MYQKQERKRTLTLTGKPWKGYLLNMVQAQAQAELTCPITLSYFNLSLSCAQVCMSTYMYAHTNANARPRPHPLHHSHQHPHPHSHAPHTHMHPQAHAYRHSRILSYYVLHCNLKEFIKNMQAIEVTVILMFTCCGPSPFSSFCAPPRHLLKG
jgi:hypothetical protein